MKSTRSDTQSALYAQGDAVRALPQGRVALLPVLALPLLALGILAAGASALVWAWSAHVPSVAPLVHRIWFVGLLITGIPIVWKTLRQATRGQFATDLVATLSVIGAVLLSEPVAGLVIVVMQSGGEALEMLAEGRASAAVRELEAASPRIAHRLRNGVVEDVPADAVAVGDELLVRPGELVPCDSIVLSGRSAVDVSRLTGEPLPLDAAEGTVLASGSANGDAPLTMRATAIAGESQYAHIVRLVRSAQASKAPIQRLADRYAVWFTPLTLIVCGLAWYFSGDARRALAVLVVATPCPLILAAPIAIIGGINRAARRQIIVRNGGALEQLAAVTTVIFDKTGTLTLGRPEVSLVLPVSAWTEREVLRLAGAVEHSAGHLLARTLVLAAEQQLAQAGERLPDATSVVEVAGRGVSGTVEGHRVTVGAASFLREQLPGAADEIDRLAARDARSPVLRAYVGVDDALAGAVEYADRIRDDARGVISALRSLGVERQALLSGDDPANVSGVAAQVGIRDWRGDLRPADKAAFIEALRADGERVLMVGDGINDAPALTSAQVGIALAAHGGGISAEAADVVLLADHLDRVPEAIRISRRTMRIARQSIVVGLALSVIAMVAAALGYLRPVVGAALQEAIDVAVIVNALRASRGSRSE